VWSPEPVKGLLAEAQLWRGRHGVIHCNAQLQAVHVHPLVACSQQQQRALRGQHLCSGHGAQGMVHSFWVPWERVHPHLYDLLCYGGPPRGDVLQQLP
jgi:hypothetical protein